MTAKKSVTTLNEHIYKIDAGEARRFQKLSGAASEVAASGIIRHLRAGRSRFGSAVPQCRPGNHRRCRRRQAIFRLNALGNYEK